MSHTQVVEPTTRPSAVPTNDYGFLTPDLSRIKIEAEKLFNWAIGHS